MYDATGKTLVRKADIVTGLAEMGVRKGCLVHVHSSLSAFGYVEGGADTVVDALLEAVGPEGTVMVPTFNHGHAEIFDIRTTPSNNGAITEVLRKRPQARRSMDPTHPYAAIGLLADRLVEGHLEAGTFSQQSPLGKLTTWGGWVLLLGAEMNSNTAAHVGEVMAHCHCLAPRGRRRKIVDALGHVVEVASGLWRDGPCLIEWEALESHMRSREQIKDGKIGDADIHLMRAADVVGGAYTLALKLCPKCPTRIKQHLPEE